MSALVVTSEVNELFFAPSQVLSPKLVSGNTYKHVAGLLKGSISCIFLQSCNLIIYSLIYVNICQYIEKREKMSIVVTVLNFLFFFFLFSFRINFPLRIKALPRETILIIKLLGVNSASKNTEVLAWTCSPLYPKE